MSAPDLEQFPYGEPGGEVAFDYSQPEWRAIDNSVHAVRTGGLTDCERFDLRWCARQYIFDTNLKEGFKIMREEYKPNLIKWERLSRQLKRTLQALRDVNGATADGYLSIFFSELQAEAARNATRLAYGKKVPPNMKFVADPRIYYMYQILNIWTRCGGSLTLSRNNSGKIQGRLLRYFSAVTSPVMKASAPSPETLPDIVARQKRLISSAL